MKLIARIIAVLSSFIAVKVLAQSYTFSTFSGVAPGDIAFDATGNMYVTGAYTGSVYKVSSTGVSSLFAGNGGSIGMADGTGTSARFNAPAGLAFDASGNLYVADSGNHTIRKITPAGVVTTFAGTPGVRGFADGNGTAAQFNTPIGVAVDASGNVFVTDSGNQLIRKITSDGTVTILAGARSAAGTDDATGPSARFNSPRLLAIDGSGNLYVADSGNHAIRKVTPDGVVTTVAGLAGSAGSADGVGAAARFSSPGGLAVDSSGNLYVADSGNYLLRKITPNGTVTTIGGSAGNSGDVAGTGSAARFSYLRGARLDANGSLFVADSYSLKVGLTSAQLALTVQPQSLTVANGSNAIFAVTATGGTPITYQWQKNGTNIPGATTPTLTLASVQSGDSASYSAVVSNSTGTLTSTSASLTVVAAVANDNFANAQQISGSSGTVSGTNNGATGELLEPTHMTLAATASSVWYKLTAAQTGTIVLDVSANFTPTIAVYTGTTLGALTRASNPTTGRATFSATAGTTYYIAVGSYYASSRGNLTVNWHTIPNDTVGRAQEYTGGSVNVDNFGTSLPLWYRWTPATSGTAVITVPNYGINLNVFTLDTGGFLNRVAFSGVPTPTSIAYGFVAQAGVTYYVSAAPSYSNTFSLDFRSLPVVTGYPGGATLVTGGNFTLGVSALSATPLSYQWMRNGQNISGATNATLPLTNVQTADAGTYTVNVSNAAGTTVVAQMADGRTPITITVLVPPANDNFANAQTISGLSGTTTGSTANATGEADEPIHWNVNGTASSVWYKWTPAGSGLAVIDTVGSNFDTVLAVYTGGAINALTRLVQDDDRGGGRTSQVSFAATSGTTYYIAVGAGSGGRGNLTLNWQLTPTLAVAAGPVSQTVAVGSTVTFTVQATGTGVTYQWNRNGVAIPGATNATLTVSNVAGGDDAAFTVTIKNASGSVTSDPAGLSVAAATGANFTVRNSRTPGRMLWGIAGNNDSTNNVMVAVGDGGTILSSSDKGKTWVPRTSGITDWIVGVTYGSGQFVAVADRGVVLLSPDGVIWTAAPSTGTTQRLNNVIFAGGQFVAVGEAGTILTSSDARTWTPRVSGVTNWLHGLAYNASTKHFAVTGQAGTILYSGDAITWTKLPVAGLTSDIEVVVAVDSYAQFVGVGQRGAAVAIRENQLKLKDGSTLNTISGDLVPTGINADFRGLAVGASALFAGGTSGKIITATSDQGPWYTLPAPTSGVLLAGIFQNDSLYMVGENETVLQSDPLYTSRMRNISTRGVVGTGGNIMISGFIVAGSGPKQVLIRAAGPTLASSFGLTDAIAAPVLTLMDGKGATIRSNTGWSTATNAAAISTAATQVSAFPFPAASADSAMLVTLDPGAYTALVSGANNTTGISIIEVYDTDRISNTGSNAINISTRGTAGTGANKLIAGFIIDGASSKRVLIRAVGPGLAAAPFNLTGTLAEPQLELYTSHNVLSATAGAWALQTNADEIRATAKAVGAFDLADGSKDSAMLVTLLPGAWTVQVSGANNTTGVALVEVYAVP